MGCAGSATSHSRMMPSFVAAGQQVPIGAERQRVHPRRHRWSGRADGLAERAGMRGIGDIPQPDDAVVVAAGQRCPSGLNASECASALPLFGGWPSGRGCAGSATSHSRMTPLASPLASAYPLIRAERHRVHGGDAGAGQGLAERARVRGIGDIREPGCAVVAAAGERVPAGAERHRVNGPGPGSQGRGEGSFRCSAGVRRGLALAGCGRPRG